MALAFGWREDRCCPEQRYSQEDGVGEKPLHCLSCALDAAAVAVAVVENTPFLQRSGVVCVEF